MINKEAIFFVSKKKKTMGCLLSPSLPPPLFVSYPISSFHLPPFLSPLPFPHSFSSLSLSCHILPYLSLIYSPILSSLISISLLLSSLPTLYLSFPLSSSLLSPASIFSSFHFLLSSISSHLLLSLLSCFYLSPLSSSPLSPSPFVLLSCTPLFQYLLSSLSTSISRYLCFPFPSSFSSPLTIYILSG